MEHLAPTLLNTMTFKVKEETCTPPEVYNFRIYLVACFVGLGGTMFGYDYAYIGSTLFLPSFIREFEFYKLNIGQLNSVSSNIISIFQGGCFFGALFASPFSERFGRKKPVIGSTLLFLLGGFLQIWSNGSLGMMYAGRFLNGFGASLSSCLAVVYIAEFSPPAIRGRLLGIYATMFQVAAVIGFWINYGTKQHIPDNSNAQWRIPVAVQVIPAGLLVISMFFVWESPRWLAQKGRLEESLTTLSHIRQLPPDHLYVLAELADIKAQIAREQEINNGATWWQLLKEFMGRGYRNRLGITVILWIFTNLTGIVAISYYAPGIFKSLGLNDTSTALMATGIFGVVALVSSFIFFIFVLDRVGRRKALLIGCWGVAIPMWYIGAYIARAKSSETDAKQTAAGWVAVVAIYVFAVFFSTSWSGIAVIFPSEVFPLRLRTLGVTITALTEWLFQFIFTKATPYMLTSMGYGTYIFFGTAMPIAFIWTYFFLPETSGLTLEEMDVLFGVPAAIKEKQAFESGGLEYGSGSGSEKKQEFE